MENEKRLAEEAMAANGLAAGQVSEEELSTLEKKLARMRRQARFMGRLALAVLGFSVLVIPAAFILRWLGVDQETLEFVAVVPWTISFQVGIVLAVFYLLRSHGASRLETQARLSRISLQLEKLARDSEDE